MDGLQWKTLLCKMDDLGGTPIFGTPHMPSSHASCSDFCRLREKNTNFHGFISQELPSAVEAEKDEANLRWWKTSTLVEFEKVKSPEVSKNQPNTIGIPVYLYPTWIFIGTEKTDEYFGFIVRITPLYKPFTPWKMNGWNLQPSPMKRQEHDLNQTSMISMLVFRGIFANIYHKNQLNIGKYILQWILWELAT